jgi:hypothetical protein
VRAGPSLLAVLLGVFVPGVERVAFWFLEAASAYEVRKGYLFLAGSCVLDAGFPAPGLPAGPSLCSLTDFVIDALVGPR